MGTLGDILATSRPLDYDGFVHVLQTGAAQVKAAAEALGKLDSATGDGDHGVAMTRAMEALEKGIDECTEKSPKTLLQGVAWSVMSIDAGSTGPLMGSLMMGMMEPVGGATEIDAALLASMFEAGQTKLLALSKASVGDKTMVDALVPAVAALRQAADSGVSVPAALDKAATAAEAGALRTKDFQARFGRARNLGPRSLGHQDPGATSISLLLRGFAEGAATLEP